jgi:hypothetical protein
MGKFSPHLVIKHFALLLIRVVAVLFLLHMALQQTTTVDIMNFSGKLTLHVVFTLGIARFSHFFPYSMLYSTSSYLKIFISVKLNICLDSFKEAVSQNYISSSTGLFELEHLSFLVSL